MNKLKTIAVLTMSMAALSTAFAAEQAVTESAQAAPVVQPQAGNVELDRIVAVVNNDVITDRELQERTHVVAINLRRQNIQLPPMEQLRAQVLERLIFERAIKQRARETGIRIDDQMVNASIEQIARQNNLSVDQLRQRLMADGVSFSPSARRSATKSRRSACANARSTPRSRFPKVKSTPTSPSRPASRRATRRNSTSGTS